MNRGGHMERERRKYPRLNLNIEVEYSVLRGADAIQVQSKNISAGGICLILYEDIQPDSVLELKFYLPRDTNPIKAIGRIVWRSEIVVADDKRTRFDAGIEFLEISDIDRTKIAQHVFSLMQQGQA